MSPSCIAKGGLTEDEYIDFDLDRNYEYKDDNLVHNIKYVGWNDPWEHIDF